MNIKNTLQEQYNNEIAKSLKTELGIKNVHAVPRLSKIILNMGVKDAIADKKNMEKGQNLNPITYLKPPKGLIALNLRDLWEYRELIYFLTWRDIKVRYKQTLLGFTWVVLQPVINMVVFTILFGQLLKVPTGGIPYPIF